MKKKKPDDVDRLDSHTDHYIHIQRKWLCLLWLIPIAIIGFIARQFLAESREAFFSIGGHDWLLGGYALTAYIGISIVGYAICRQMFFVGLLVVLLLGLLWGLLGGLLLGLLGGLLGGLFVGLFWGLLLGLLGGLLNDEERYPWER